MTAAKQLWLSLIGVNVLVVAGIAYSAFAPGASTKTMLLPGKTSHGHYQIEMRCDLCHTEGSGLREDACTSCHAEELRLAKDTHPSSKFNDPTNAELLSVLDATNCVTCHREHVDEQTLPMGLTLPSDYCYHCHQETLETRPSHAEFKFDSCATAGCHNYHDNRALYENFLLKHADEDDFLDEMVGLAREPMLVDSKKSLSETDADAPEEWSGTDPDSVDVLNDWASTAHASAGVNCSGCHLQTPSDETEADSKSDPVWNREVSVQMCGTCHPGQMETFFQGHHGMRLAAGLSAMTPGDARISMHADAAHRQLDCNACHAGHRFDTEYASVDACLECHADGHSQAFLTTSHYAAWQNEIAGTAPAGSGVSCATCHMPRVEDDDGNVWANHNQNDNLRPNEKMIRDVCMQCHGLGFSIDALADPQLIENCFAETPAVHVESIDLVKARFEERQRKKEARSKKK
ncbi:MULTISPECIES: ammonia-forming cytochrome c nitrite reductase subunit c552 [Rhodopirellula]|uniref:ammonia-forming cytochrome c nitrite reductase subunit c552 n=1 Tax=Rhodopirellula TaxID=265488 RepID=UPI00257E0024|nr:ammonia-forming cytochrome c nitrite reductase subunit c552 [Rhodopirellula sp. UBA1907]